MARLEKQFESATVEWPTPDTLWKPLDDEFGFTLDVCATPENAKCARYFTKAQDGLAQEWQGVCWMNPPYGREMVGWLKRAEAEKSNGVTTVALIPSRTNTGWWHDIVMPNEVRFVRGRPKFGNAAQGLPWPLAVIVFRASAHEPLFNVEYQDDAGGWRLWKDDMNRADAEKLSASIETRKTRIISSENAEVRHGASNADPN